MNCDTNTYQVDTEEPNIKTTSASTEWGQTNRLEATIEDSLSGIEGYAFDKNSDTSIDTKWTTNTDYPKTEQTYNGVADSNGNWYIHVKDQAGNISSSKIEVSKVDVTPATATFEIESQKAGSSGWKQALTLKVTPSDLESGVSSTKYCLTTEGTCDPKENAALKEGFFSVVFPNDAKAQKVCVKITNGVNIESGVLCDTKTYQVDGASPTFTNLKLSASEKTITALIEGASDTGGSNISQYVFQLDTGSPQTSTTNSMQFTGLARGKKYTVKGYVVDYAGNSSETKSGEILVPYPLLTDVIKEITPVSSNDGLYEIVPTSTLSGWNTKELRFAGTNPSNCVTFNGETWRIIGLVNVKTASGTMEQRVKIIRNESFSAIPWDSSGKNDWTKSSAKALLNNGAYYNRTGQYATTGLTQSAKNMIDTNIVWTLGGSSTYNNVTVQQFYERERGNTVSQGSATEWKTTGTDKASVGLMYPSDYGYATVGGSHTSRDSCLKWYMYNWYGEDGSYQSDCANWIAFGGYAEDYYDISWTMTPLTSTTNKVFGLDNHGPIYSYESNLDVYEDEWTDSYNIVPVIYLLPTIRVTRGTGMSSSPYILSVE